MPEASSAAGVVPLFCGSDAADAAMTWWTADSDAVVEGTEGTEAGGAAGGADAVPRQHPSRTSAFFAAATAAAGPLLPRAALPGGVALEGMPSMSDEALFYDLADTSDEEAEEARQSQGSQDEAVHARAASPAARRGLKRAAAFESDARGDRDARRKARRANLRLAGEQRIRAGAVLVIGGVSLHRAAAPPP